MSSAYWETKLTLVNIRWPESGTARRSFGRALAPHVRQIFRQVAPRATRQPATPPKVARRASTSVTGQLAAANASRPYDRQRRRRSGFPLGQRRSPSMTDRGRQSAAGLSTMRPKSQPVSGHAARAARRVRSAVCCPLLPSRPSSPVVKAIVTTACLFRHRPSRAPHPDIAGRSDRQHRRRTAHRQP